MRPDRVYYVATLLGRWGLKRELVVRTLPSELVTKLPVQPNDADQWVSDILFLAGLEDFRGLELSPLEAWRNAIETALEFFPSRLSQFREAMVGPAAGEVSFAASSPSRTVSGGNELGVCFMAVRIAPDAPSLGTELRSVYTGVQLVDLVTDARTSDLFDVLIRSTADMLHYSGVATRSSSSLLFVADDGGHEEVGGHILRGLIEARLPSLPRFRVVLLMANHTSKVAEHLVATPAVVDSCIYISGAIHNMSFQQFIVGFYTATGQGFPPEDAYRMGLLRMQMHPFTRNDVELVMFSSADTGD